MFFRRYLILIISDQRTTGRPAALENLYELNANRSSNCDQLVRFDYMSVRTCWRRPLDTTNLKYYLRGKTFGMVMTVSLAFIFPEIYRFPGMQYWLEVVFAFVTFPIATVGGYLFESLCAINQQQTLTARFLIGWK